VIFSRHGILDAQGDLSIDSGSNRAPLPSHGVAKHKAIIDELLKDPEARAVIDRAVQRDSRYNQRSMAGIMIAALSQKHTTVGLGDFSRRFETKRRKRDVHLLPGDVKRANNSFNAGARSWCLGSVEAAACLIWNA
jgi:hypothetical protein